MNTPWVVAELPKTQPAVCSKAPAPTGGSYITQRQEGPKKMMTRSETSHTPVKIINYVINQRRVSLSSLPWFGGDHP